MGRVWLLLLILWGSVLLPSRVVRADQQGTVVITHIQAGAVGAATQEFVVIHNNSSDEVDITGWCLRNKTDTPFACFSDAANPLMAFVLPAYTSAYAMSAAYAEQWVGDGAPTLTFQPANQSSGSLVGAADTVRLVDAQGSERDSYAWKTALPAGQMAYRPFFIEYEKGRLYSLEEPSSWSIGGGDILPEDAGVIILLDGEPCAHSCEDVLPEVWITELLPNPTGVDAGREFIEFYNSGGEAIDLKGYVVEVQGSTTKRHVITTELPISSGEYAVVYNDTLPFTLPNTVASVSLLNPGGQVVDKSAAYENPKDDIAWALIDQEWTFTDRPTPGQVNLPNGPPATAKISTTTSLLKPCADNQYRSTETNRCRTIVTPAVPTACQQGYYRHPETNRCRKLATATTPVACKEGQERNPETGRCRTVKQLKEVDYSVLGARQENRPQQWYVVIAIVLLLLGLVFYGVWEWRDVIGRRLRQLRRFVVRRQ